MTKLAILVICLNLTGCFYQTVNSWDIERASQVCGGVENVVEINAMFSGDEFVACRTGDEFNLHGVKIPQ
jgi:hypothetical protein